MAEVKQMPANYSDKRKSGISLVGDISWGATLCQFYLTPGDILDVLVPFLEAGLKNRECCIWITSEPLTVPAASAAIEASIPDIARYSEIGQFEIISTDLWNTRDSKTVTGLLARLDKAILQGFDGLRVAFVSPPGNKKEEVFDEVARACSQYNILCMFSYPRNEFDAVSLMEIVKNHQCALIRNANQWEMIESQEARLARESMNRSEERLRSLFLHMSEGFAYHRILLDEKGKPCDYVFLEVNEAFKKMLGLNSSDIIGKRVTEVLPGIEKDPVDWIGKYGEVALTGQPVRFEIYSPVIGRWYSVSAFSPHKGFFAVTFNDITERKKQEADLLAAKNEWEQTFDSVPDLIAILDNHHRVIRANRAMSEKLGVTQDKCSGLECYKVVHGMDCPPDFCPHSQTCRDGREHLVEVYEPSLGGYYLVSTTPVFNSQGELVGSTHVARDITERKAAENALKVNNERLQILYEAGSLLLSSDSPEKIVQTIAEKVMHHLDCDCFLNYVVDEKTGKLKLNTYAGITDEIARGINTLDYREALCGCSAGDGRSTIMENVQENQDIRTVLLRSSGIRAYADHPLKMGGKTFGTLSFGTRSRDKFKDDELELMKTIAGQVSVAMERKLAEESLKQRTLELEASNKELESFSYTVSHDLRAPLRSMDGFSQALLEEYASQLDAQGQDWLKRIRTSSQMMSQLIDDILGLSRVIRVELKIEKVDLSEIAHSVAAELQTAQPERQVEFIIAPHIQARGDHNLLRMLLINLLGNAYKFTSRSSSPRIEFGSTIIGSRRFYYVKDNGAGFDMKFADKLFKPFQRLHSSGDFPGTGVGLATVQRIVQRHGGTVAAEGEPGRGAVFYFSLDQEISG